MSNNDDDDTFDKENENINTELESFSKDVTLIDEIETLQNKIQILENEKRELEYQVEHYQNYTEEIEDEKNTLEETLSKMNDCKLLDNSINLDYERLLKENKDIKEENEMYKIELIAKDKEIDILTNEIKNIERMKILEKNHNEYQQFVENKIKEMKYIFSDTIDITKIQELSNRMLEISKELKKKEEELESNKEIIMDMSNQLFAIEEENTKLKDLLPYRLDSNSFGSVGSDFPYSPSIGSQGELNEYLSSPTPPTTTLTSPLHDKSVDNSIKIEIMESIEEHLDDLRRKEELIDESDDKKDKMEEEINRMNSLMEETNKELENIEKSINEIKTKVDKEIKQSKQNYS